MVTDGSTAAPLQGVEVTAQYEASPGDWEDVSETTDANGHYILSGLPEGDYMINFWPSNPKYLGEYYNDQRYRENANLVHLAEGESLSGIDASLAFSGRITGQVVNAVGGIPIEGVSVCAYSQTIFTGGCDTTDASGDYTIKRLVTDSYRVYFDPSWSVNYFARWYKEAASLKEGEWVLVKEGATTPEIDEALYEAAGVAGTVVDAETAQPLPSVQVCAIEVGGKNSRAVATPPGMAAI